jgi:hypothetical protein
MVTPLQKWLTNIALIAVSLLLALALVEFWVRRARTLESLFDPLRYEPEAASMGWKRCFVRDYAKLKRKGRIGDDLGGYLYDPELGWDTPQHVHGLHEYHVDKPSGVFRVVVTGDSYTYGAEVRDDETYPSRVEALLRNGEVVNLGVRAYGIDQAALKYLKYGRAYSPDLLIVAIWGPDYLRVPLTFYRFAKPAYVIDPKTHALTLTNVPIPPPEETYRKLKGELGPFSYTYALLREVYRLKFGEDRGLETYYGKWDPVIEAILDNLVDVTKQDGTPVLFILIESGEEFRSDEAIANKCCEREHLLKIFQRLRVAAIDLGDALLERYPRNVVYKDMYISHDGIPNGHFTPFGNEAVARVIGDYIHQKFGVEIAGAPPT